MRILVLYLLLILCTEIQATEKTLLVLWKADLSKESERNKYPFSEIADYLYKSIQNKKILFYTDSSCKNKLNKETFTQSLYEKNQSVAGYTIIKVQEEWKFSPEGIISKVVFFCFENPNLSDNDIHRKLYVPQKLIPTLLREITLSGYYRGRANVPLSEWIKKHDFEYTVLKTSAGLPEKPTFQYNKEIDDTTYKNVQLLFDFFPEKNRVFGQNYTRDKNVEENFMYLPKYNNEAQSNEFRNILLEALEKNKLIKSNADIEEMLQNAPANYVFYFDALHTQAGIQWTNIRVYISAGKNATIPHVLCANIPQNKIKTIENYFKKRSKYSFTEYFTKAKIDVLVSYINNSYAKDTEEGLVLRNYLLGF